MPQYNPLDVIRIGTEHDAADARKIATLIVDPDGKGLQTHWQNTSQDLLVGVILHAVYGGRPGDPLDAPDLGGIHRRLSAPDQDLAVVWDEMLAFEHFDQPDPRGVGPNSRTHPTVARAARDMKDRPFQEAQAVLLTARHSLEIYRGPDHLEERRA